ncbi:cytochrome P450 [Allokutzneria albata]|uniref:Cytochrome P450 n=1 Tax=Allokutzneria albata TaxID=211114 RepID=A0A1H0C6U7_ALLAB|nr:cytochrome P450 [Allokutzneria albata]SDN53585.1 Cytochrome P450 [Allokutzneria albata]
MSSHFPDEDRGPASCPFSGRRVPLYGPDFTADPSAVYERLREQGQTAPVELAPGVHATLVLGYDAALEVLRSPGTFVRDGRRWQATMPPDSPVLPVMGYRPTCLMSDGDAHARLRRVISDAYGKIDPNMIRAHVEATAEMLIGRFAAAGEVNLLADYAVALPLWVFNYLHGCPTELGDRLVSGMSRVVDVVEAEQANVDLTRALTELVALKRREPGHDVTSWMMAHPARLNDEEMLHQLVIVLGAVTQHEANLIANALRLLLSDDRFAGDLAGGSMQIEDALDEVLWTDPPMTNLSVTFPTHPVNVGGVTLPADQPVLIGYAAANADPTVHGGHRAGNRAHLSWGAGPHACPVQGTARLIASIAIEKLLDRLPDLHLAVPEERLEWRPSPFFRSLTALPVKFTPVRAAGADTVSVPSWARLTPSSVPQLPQEQPPPPEGWRHALGRWWRGQ